MKESSIKRFKNYKSLGDRTFAVLNKDEFYFVQQYLIPNPSEVSSTSAFVPEKLFRLDSRV